MNILGRYVNGNYTVTLLKDGTKIRANNEHHFAPEAPESMDIKITNKCDMNCPFCHEDSTPTGVHGDIMGAKFIETLHPYTELAIGGGNPLCHPDLDEFLLKCKRLKLIPSMTVNQKHFIESFDRIKKLCDEELIYGLGVSISTPDEDFIKKVSQIPNAVIHVIAGNTSMEDLTKISNRKLKILILGYKHFRRGDQYYIKNQHRIFIQLQFLKSQLKYLLPCFSVVSFDNLAIKQLNVQAFIPYDEWDQFYMGDDGQFTMYIDMVNQEFAQSSTSTRRHPMQDDIKSMFEAVQRDKDL